MVWMVEMFFHGEWVVLKKGYANRDAAEWAVAIFKQANDMRTDPFRYSQVDPDACLTVKGTMSKASYAQAADRAKREQWFVGQWNQFNPLNHEQSK